MRLGLGLGIADWRGSGSASSEPPTIDADTTFATSTGWTLNDTGGTAGVEIADGVLKLTGGTDSANTWAEAVVTGIAETDVVTLQYEVTSVLGTTPIFSIGGGTEVLGAGTVGTNTVELTCGATGTNLRARQSSSITGRHVHLDNLAFI